jgi:hypothetical protein
LCDTAKPLLGVPKMLKSGDHLARPHDAFAPSNTKPEQARQRIDPDSRVAYPGVRDLEK